MNKTEGTCCIGSNPNALTAAVLMCKSIATGLLQQELYDDTPLRHLKILAIAALIGVGFYYLAHFGLSLPQR
jgi:hypothetical protein